MKKIIPLILFVYCFTCKAQINGNVVDTNNQPISFANAILMSAIDSTTIDGKLTLEDGSFNIQEPKKGTYFLLVNLLSYNDWYSPQFEINISNSQILFKDIVLKEETTSLEEVVLTSNKKVIQQTIEGTTINVQKSIMTKGSNLLQLLERSPGVLLDQRNNSFTLNGKNGTIIMINNKPLRLPASEVIGMLNGISADNIDKIELLTNPSSKHDAEGNAGIINIVLLKNENIGTNGSYSITSGYGYGPKKSLSFNLNKTGKKNAFYGSYSFSYDHTFKKWSAIANTNIPVLGGDTDVLFKSEIEDINRNHNINIGFTSKLSKKAIIGMDILSNNALPDNKRSNYGSYYFSDNTSLNADIDVLTDGKWTNFSSTAFYELNFNKKNTLFTSFDYIAYTNNNKTFVSNNYFDEYQNEILPNNDVYNRGNKGQNKTSVDVGVIKMDYENKWEQNSLEIGMKFTTSSTSNKGSIDVIEEGSYKIDPKYDTNSTVDEVIMALYSSMNFKIDSTWSITTGLRYENWDRKFDNRTLNKKFGKLFPTIYLSKKITPNSSLNLSYTKRISRPSYNDLASSLTYNDPTSVFVGNPLLKSAIINNINLNYNLKSYNISLGYSHESNSIARFQIVQNDQSDILAISPQNIDYLKSFFIQTNIPIRINHWWNLNFNSSISTRKFYITYTPTPFTHKYVNININGSHHFKITENISAEISGWYNSTHYNGSIKVEGFGAINMGLKKEFKNGGNLQFSITDIFKTININSHYGSLVKEAYNNTAHVNFQPESTNNQILKISYFKNFGKKNEKKRAVISGTEDEKNRIN